MNLMLISGIACFVIGCLFFWVYRFVTNIVKSELSAQKIYFPEQGSPEFDSTVYPDLQQYAGQLVDNPKKARAYADGFIGRHLKKIANGKTYAELNVASMKNPVDKKLQQQKQVLFQGEALRGLLLMGGYGFGTIGRVAGLVCYATFTISCFFFLLYIIFLIET